jgi:sec-independent protein translocase protein TatA
MGSLSIWHWIVVVVVVLLLFGRNKISDLMGDAAKGIKAFKKGMQDDDTAEAKPAEPAKTIEHQTPAAPGTTTTTTTTVQGDLRGRAETERKVEGSTS